MISKNTAKILLISLVLSSLSGCGNSNVDKKAFNNAPYYAITITSHEKLRNDYVDVDVKIPKIVYTGTRSNAFIESLNSKIKNDVTSIVEEAKKTAKNNYSKNNRQDKMPSDDMHKRPSIATYSDIIKSPNEIPFKDRPERPFRATNSEINRFQSDMPFKDKPERPFRSTNSEINKFRDEIPNAYETVVGFTNSDNLIIPELHNKNIIVVETTKKETEEAETTTKSRNRSERIAPSEGGNFGDFPSDFRDRNFEGKIATPAALANNTLTTITCDYAIFCLDSDYISLNITVNVYGKTSETKNFFYNIDLKNEKTLTIKDMLKDNNKEINEDSNFFINSNHTPVMVDDESNLSILQ